MVNNTDTESDPTILGTARARNSQPKSARDKEHSNNFRDFLLVNAVLFGGIVALAFAESRWGDESVFVVCVGLLGVASMALSIAAARRRNVPRALTFACLTLSFGWVCVAFFLAEEQFRLVFRLWQRVSGVMNQGDAF